MKNLKTGAVPQRIQAAALGLDASIAELKETVSQVQREVSQGEPPCNSTFFHQILCSLSSLNLSFDKRTMQSAKSGKTLTQQLGQQKGILTTVNMTKQPGEKG
jgi:hypothetical protein